MHMSMAVDSWLQADWCLCLRWLMHSSMAVNAWLSDVRLVYMYLLADAHLYDSKYMALGPVFGVCVYAG